MVRSEGHSQLLQWKVMIAQFTDQKHSQVQSPLTEGKTGSQGNKILQRHNKYT